MASLQEKYSKTEIYLVLGSSTLAAVPLALHSFLSLLVLTTWAERLTHMTSVESWQDPGRGSTQIISKAKRCLNMYNNLDQGMGSFFFLFMSMNQVAWIFYIFITISSFGGKMDASSFSLSLSFGLGTLGLLLSVLGVTLALDRCSQKF